MKKVCVILVATVLSGCAKSSFEPDMKGVAFWESPQQVERVINQRVWNFSESFTSFVIPAKSTGWDDFQFVPRIGVGIPELMANRVTDGYKTLLREEDVTSIKWKKSDSSHGSGAFVFDAFYGSGRIAFKALKINGEWVIPYMAIPRKDKADDDDPYVIFDLSEDEVAKLMQ